MGFYIYIYKFNIYINQFLSYLNKYEDIICIKMNQQYNSIILLIIYNVLLDMLQLTIYFDQYLSQSYTS
jgi:hypothetical protein